MCNLCWTQSSKNLKFRGKLSPILFGRQAFNHFENHFEISNKMNLFQNMKRICGQNGRSVFNFMPLTFDYNLDHEIFEEEIGHFFRYFKALQMFNMLAQRKDLEHQPDEDFFYLMEKFGNKSGDNDQVSNRTFFLEQMNRRVSPLRNGQDAHWQRLGRAGDSPRDAEKESVGPKSRFFNLNNFYLRILHENLKKEPPNRDLEWGPIALKMNPVHGAPDQKRKRLFKRLLRILDYPSAVEDDSIDKILNLSSSKAKKNPQSKGEAPGQASQGKGLLSQSQEIPISFSQTGKKSKIVCEDLHLKHKFDVEKERRENAIEAKRKWEMAEVKRRFRATLFDKDRESLVFPREESRFCEYYNCALAGSFNVGKNIWLLKVTSYNRGFGIELFSDLESFVKHLFNFSMGYEEHIDEEAGTEES